MNMESPASPEGLKGEKLRAAGNQVDESSSSSAELQTPSQSMLSDADIIMVASHVSPKQYISLGEKLGVRYPVLEQIRAKHLNDFNAATVNLVQRWKQGATRTKQDLANELQKVGLREPAEKLLGESQENYTDQASDRKESQRAAYRNIPSMSPELLQRCVNELKQYNKQYLSTLQAEPLNPESHIQLEHIFTNLKLLEEVGDGHTRRKTPLDYNDLLSTKVNGVIPNRLLVEGEGGAGKTTLCKKIVWDWTHEKAFQQFKMVFYIPLQKAKDRTVGQIVKDYLSDSNPVEAWQLDEYILTNPEDVFLIFDAFDEFDLEFNHQIVAIILNRRFKSCTVLVTTRSWRAAEIRLKKDVRQAYAFIAVEGFTQENLASYIAKFFAHDKESADELNEFMKENDVIAENMAPFPIYTAMLCIMWQDYDGEHRKAMCKLQTFSQLFGEIVSFLVDHYISKAAESSTNFKLPERRQTIHRLFPLIGRMAFQGLAVRKMVFSEEDFKTNQGAIEIFCHVGVLTREEHVRPRRERPATSSLTVSTVQFPHKLFQEYLAGIYLDSLFGSDQSRYDKLMDDVIHKAEEFRYLLYFSAAQSKEVGFDVLTRLIRNLPGSSDRGLLSGRKLDFFVDVAFECHNPAVVAKAVGDGEVLSTQILGASSASHTISGYLFIREHLKLTELRVLRSCGRTVSFDIAELMCCSPSLRSLHIGAYYNQIKLHDVFYTALASQAGRSMIETLTELTLQCFKPPAIDAFYSMLSSMASSSKIETLVIGVNLLEGDSASRDLARFICKMPRLTNLTLRGHNLLAKDAFYSTLATMALLLQIKTLHIIGIEFREGDSASRDLARFICKMPHLTDLTLGGHNLPANYTFCSTLASLALSLKVKSLNIRFIELPVGDSALRELGRFICEMPRLIELVLEYLNLQANDAFWSTLASMASSSKIQALLISNVDLPEGESASHDLARFICEMPRLKDLTLYELNLPANDAFCSTLASMASSSKVDTLELRYLTISTRLFCELVSLPMLHAVTFDMVWFDSKTENDGESDASVTSESELTEDDGESAAYVTSASELTKDVDKSDAPITSASGLTDDDDDRDAPVTSVRVLSVCNTTLSDWRFGSMARMFPSVEIVTLMLWKDWSPDTLYQLQFPGVEELTLQGVHLSRVHLTVKPSSLCSIFQEAFSRLVEVTFSEIVIGNDNAADLVRGLMSHEQLKTIRLVRCYTDEGLDPVLEDINREGRVRVDAEHGVAEDDC